MNEILNSQKDSVVSVFTSNTKSSKRTTIMYERLYITRDSSFGITKTTIHLDFIAVSPDDDFKVIGLDADNKEKAFAFTKAIIFGITKLILEGHVSIVKIFIIRRMMNLLEKKSY